MEKTDRPYPPDRIERAGCVRPATIQEVLAFRAKQLRDEAHKLEQLSEELKHGLNLSPAAEEQLRSVVIEGLNRPRPF